MFLLRVKFLLQVFIKPTGTYSFNSATGSETCLLNQNTAFIQRFISPSLSAAVGGNVTQHKLLI